METKNQLQIFQSEQFGNIRTVQENSKVLFCGSDVAKALGYARPNEAIKAHCRATVKRSTPISGKMQDINFIPEGDVYRLITHSKLPQAEQFEKWVFDEVLPSIRKTGGYIAGQEQMSEMELVSRALLVVKNQLDERNKQVEQQSQRIEQMRPKEIFADAVSAAKTSILIRDLAKLLRQNGVQMGEKRLYKWLRENGYICKSSTSPTQKAMELGLFEISLRTIERGGGELPVETQTTKVTGKGQVYFVNQFLSKAV